jgi:hypothetical protein
LTGIKVLKAKRHFATILSLQELRLNDRFNSWGEHPNYRDCESQEWSLKGTPKLSSFLWRSDHFSGCCRDSSAQKEGNAEGSL